MLAMEVYLDSLPLLQDKLTQDLLSPVYSATLKFVFVAMVPVHYEIHIP